MEGLLFGILHYLMVHVHEVNLPQVFPAKLLLCMDFSYLIFHQVSV